MQKGILHHDRRNPNLGVRRALHKVPHERSIDGSFCISFVRLTFHFRTSTAAHAQPFVTLLPHTEIPLARETHYMNSFVIYRRRCSRPILAAVLELFLPVSFKTYLARAHIMSVTTNRQVLYYRPQKNCTLSMPNIRSGPQHGD